MTYLKRFILLFISFAYLYVEYFFREHLLMVSSQYGYSLDVTALETFGRVIAAFGLAWFVLLIVHKKFGGSSWKIFFKSALLFISVFIAFFNIQRLGVDWYVNALNDEQKKVAVGAQTFKAFTYYQEKSGKQGYNPDGKMSVVDKLLISFLPWIASDNDSVRNAMATRLVVTAQSNVKNELRYHSFPYKRIQDGVESALRGMSYNYVGSLNNKKSGVDQLLAEPKFSKTVDEYHAKLQLMAIQEFYRYRDTVLAPYRGRLGSHFDEHMTGLDRYFYTQTYPNARHPRVTSSGFVGGQWLTVRPPRTLTQGMLGNYKSQNLINPVSKLDAFFAKYRYHETVDTVSALEERTTAFESALRASLTGLSIPDGVLLGEYQEAVNTVKACRSFDSPQALSRAYDHTWNGKGYHFVQVSSHWRQSGFDYKNRSRVSVTARAPLNMGKRPLVFGSETFNASKVEGMKKAGVTVCDPYQYQSVFNRYAYRLVQSINKGLYESETDMVSFNQFAKSAYWNKQVPSKVAQYGFEVKNGFNWQSKRAIGAAYRKHVIDNQRRLFEEKLLERLADFSSHYDLAAVREIYQNAGKRLPLWRYDESNASVRKVMRHLSEQPVVRTVIKKEYPFMFDTNGVLLINYLYESPREYKNEHALDKAFLINTERVLKDQIKAQLTDTSSDFYDKQVRAYIMVPLALLLSTLFIFLNAVNLTFLLLQWTSLPSVVLKGLQLGVIAIVIALPMFSNNEYTESKFYDNYLAYGSSTIVINMVTWLQGSAPVFDAINEGMGDTMYRAGNRKIEQLVEDFSS